MMQSVFISFGGPDEAFARKLNEALHSNGVRTFFFRNMPNRAKNSIA